MKQKNEKADAEAEDYKQIVSEDEICNNISCRIILPIVVSVIVVVIVTFGILYYN